MTRSTAIAEVVNQDELDADDLFALALRQLKLADEKGHGLARQWLQWDKKVRLGGRRHKVDEHTQKVEQRIADGHAASAAIEFAVRSSGLDSPGRKNLKARLHRKFS